MLYSICENLHIRDKLNFGISCRTLREITQAYLNTVHATIFYYVNPSNDGAITLAASILGNKKMIYRSDEEIEQTEIVIAKYDPEFTDILSLPKVMIFGDEIMSSTSPQYKFANDKRIDSYKVDVLPKHVRCWNNYYYIPSLRVLTAIGYDDFYYMSDVDIITDRKNYFMYKVGNRTFRVTRQAKTDKLNYASTNIINMTKCYLCTNTCDILFCNFSFRTSLVSIIRCLSHDKY